MPLGLALVILYFSNEKFAEILAERSTLAAPYDFGYYGRYNRYFLAIPLIVDHPFGLGVLQIDKYLPEGIHDIWIGSFLYYGWLGGFAWTLLMVLSVQQAWYTWRRSRSSMYLLILFSWLSVISCAMLQELERWRFCGCLQELMGTELSQLHRGFAGRRRRYGSDCLPKRGVRLFPFFGKRCVARAGWSSLAVLLATIRGAGTAGANAPCLECIEVRLEQPSWCEGRQVTSRTRRSASSGFLMGRFGPLLPARPWPSTAERRSIWADRCGRFSGRDRRAAHRIAAVG